jgi:hypothetical protein
LNLYSGLQLLGTQRLRRPISGYKGVITLMDCGLAIGACKKVPWSQLLALEVVRENLGQGKTGIFLGSPGSSWTNISTCRSRIQMFRSMCKAIMRRLTRHDVHTSEHDLQAFSQYCLNCHKPETDMFPKLNHQAASNCITCRACRYRKRI